MNVKMACWARFRGAGEEEGEREGGRERERCLWGIFPPKLHMPGDCQVLKGTYRVNDTSFPYPQL